MYIYIYTWIIYAYYDITSYANMYAYLYTYIYIMLDFLLLKKKTAEVKD